MIEDGDVVSILGPNGVGKTTLAKSICRMRKPDAGIIVVDDRDIREYRPREFARHLSYVPQRALAASMTVFDSILTGRRPHIDWAVTGRDEAIAWDVLSLFSMEHLALKNIDEISGGELQKVQIARAVVQNAGAMILDEPTNNLDLANQHSVLGLIRRIVKTNDSCAVMIMHDINTAACYSDRFVFMKKGRIQSYGGREAITPETVEEVYGVRSEVMTVDGLPVVVPRIDGRAGSSPDGGMPEWMRGGAV